MPHNAKDGPNLASPAGRRVAFFGGSFDPPHAGHLAIARAARDTLQLSTILFAPVGLQPLKPDGPSASFADRFAMTQLAISGESSFQVTRADAPNNTPNYTIDTLLSLSARLSPDDILYLLLGADSFRTLPRWHLAAEIPFAARLVVASRPGEEISCPSAGLPEGILADPAAEPNHFLLHNASGRSSELVFLPGLHYEISATELRRQMQQDTSPASYTGPQLIAPAVLDYIRRHHLYR